MVQIYTSAFLKLGLLSGLGHVSDSYGQRRTLRKGFIALWRPSGRNAFGAVSIGAVELEIDHCSAEITFHESAEIENSFVGWRIKMNSRVLFQTVLL